MANPFGVATNTAAQESLTVPHASAIPAFISPSSLATGSGILIPNSTFVPFALQLHVKGSSLADNSDVDLNVTVANVFMQQGWL